MHQGAGPGWRRDGITVPCRCAWRAGLGEVLVHENTGHGLGALGGSVVSGRRARRASHGRPRSDLPRGSGPGVLG
jgi:hypothetical protein